mgnify:CR=1 FL=1
MLEPTPPTDQPPDEVLQVEPEEAAFELVASDGFLNGARSLS